MVSEAQAISQFQAVVKIADQSIRFFTTNGTNLVTLLTNVETALVGGGASQLEAALVQIRSAAFSCYQANSPSIGAALMTWAQVINQNAGTVSAASALALIFQRMVTQSYAIQSRQFTRGAVTPVGNTKAPGASIVGNGAGYRIFCDWAGNPMEASFAEVKQFTCVGDQYSVGGNSYGNPGREQFQVQGATTALEGAFGLTLNGSGLSTTIEGQTTQQSICTNSDLSQNSGAGVATSIAGWTPTSSISNFTIDLTHTFRALTGGLTPTSVEITAADTIYQTLTTNAIDPTIPVLPVVAYNRQQDSGLATLILTLGSQSWTLVLAAQTGWNWFVPPNFNKALWYQNFTQNNLKFSVGLSAYTSGGVLIAEPMLLPASFVDGSGWWILGNSTPFALGDYLTATDEVVESEIQQEMFRQFQVYLPSAPPAPGAGLAAALAGAGAGNLSNGVYKYVITKVRPNSESGISTSVSVTVVNHTTNGQVSVSGFPTDTDPGITGYNIYRTQVGGSSYTYVTQIAYASIGTPYVDNASDASIVGNAAPPAGVTISEP